MTELIQCKDVPRRLQQKCPLCGELQTIIMRGLTLDLDTFETSVAVDRGYSFCNCYNIFYTAWNNIDKTLYDERYRARYDTEDVRNIAQNEIEVLLPILKELNTDIRTFLEVGCIRDTVLDYVHSNRISVTGLDITGHKSSHKLIEADFDHHIPYRKYDVIHASHVFEHLKSPHDAMERFHYMLADDGLLYIAMPDTFWIDFQNNPLKWDWHVMEHHTLWGMDSFIDYAEERGFKCVFKQRGTDLFKQERGNYFWKQDFKVILRRQ